MTMTFVNESSYPLVLKTGNRTVPLGKKSKQVLPVQADETVEIGIDKKNKIRFSLFLIWAGAIASQQAKIRVYCDAIMQSPSLVTDSVIRIENNTARSDNIYYEAVALQSEQPLPRVQYQIAELESVRKKFTVLSWLLDGLPLALIGWFCLLGAFSWSLLVALLILTTIGIAVPIRASKRFRQHCSNEKADELLHLSIEEKLHRLVFGEDDSE